MKIATMDTAERNGQAARAGHPFVAARTRAGNAWVVCLTDAAGSADEERAGAAAALANQAFLEACRAYEGLQAGTRLQEALLHANDQLDDWWEEHEGERIAVALTAVGLSEAGADYLAVGDGTVVVFDAEGPTVLRRGLQDRTKENGPRTGLRGKPAEPGRRRTRTVPDAAEPEGRRRRGQRPPRRPGRRGLPLDRHDQPAAAATGGGAGRRRERRDAEPATGSPRVRRERVVSRCKPWTASRAAKQPYAGCSTTPPRPPRRAPDARCTRTGRGRCSAADGRTPT